MSRRPAGTRIVLPTAAAIAIALLAGSPARAHCDTLDGPVVVDARTALDRADVTPVLKWVKEESEGEIRSAFARALAVRAAGAEAKALADTWFFETLVRVHRAGEGAPYTGLKPAGSPIEPGIAEADAALAAGSAEGLAARLAKDAASAVGARFRRVLETKKRAGDSVEAGREYVESYVDYVHFVERLQQAIGAPRGHSEGAGPACGGHPPGGEPSRE